MLPKIDNISFSTHPLTIKNKLCWPPGETLPPHLSPFVGERRVGDYIPPEERQLTATADTPDVAALEQEVEEDEEEEEEEDEDESEMSEEEETEEKEEVKEGRREKTDKEAEKKMQETEEYRWISKLHKLFSVFRLTFKSCKK